MIGDPAFAGEIPLVHLQHLQKLGQFMTRAAAFSAALQLRLACERFRGSDA
jgi:hypothetical protein